MFVPRAVKKKQAVKSTPLPSSSSAKAGVVVRACTVGTEVSSSSVPSPARPVADADPQLSRPTPKPSQHQLETQDIQAVTLLELVFSEHALWTPDELHLVARANQNQGFVPLSFLLANHPALESISHLAHPTLTRALRQHGTPGLLRTRLAITEPRAWGGSKSYGEPGVEIGRADWGTEEARLGKADEPWVDRTLYVENFPSHLRGHAPIALFLVSLLAAPSSSPSSSVQPVVQSVSFGGPTFKNFAWVVLRDEAAVEHACEEWSWAGAVGRGKRVAKGTETDHEREANAAREAGLRVLPKRDHVLLEAEYLAHLATFPSIAARPSTDRSKPFASQDLPREVSAGPARWTGSAAAAARLPLSTPTPAPTRVSAPLDYPIGCLLFAKNLNPDSSNKTSLKALFNDGLRADESVSQGREVTYVDWSKGLDTCYVRVPHPTLSPLLLTHFARPESPVVLEVIQGDREAIYWRANVKEAIRLEAVGIANGVEDVEGAQQHTGGKKRRKI